MSAGRADHSKSELAYRAIRSRILEGSYRPGQRLVLSKLAQELQISSLPIREALRRLEAEGLVDFTRNIGAEVTNIDPGQYIETLHVLAVLEGVATAQAAPHLTVDQLAEARALTDRMQDVAAQGDMRSFTLINQEFHELVCSACPSAYLRSMVHREWSRLEAIRQSTFGMMPGRPEQSIEEHRLLVALIEAGASASEIERVAREHKLRTLSAFKAAEDSVARRGSRERAH